MPYSVCAKKRLACSKGDRSLYSAALASELPQCYCSCMLCQNSSSLRWSDRVGPCQLGCTAICRQRTPLLCRCTRRQPCHAYLLYALSDPAKPAIHCLQTGTVVQQHFDARVTLHTPAQLLHVQNRRAEHPHLHILFCSLKPCTLSTTAITTMTSIASTDHSQPGPVLASTL